VDRGTVQLLICPRCGGSKWFLDRETHTCANSLCCAQVITTVKIVGYGRNRDRSFLYAPERYGVRRLGA